MHFWGIVVHYSLYALFWIEKILPTRTTSVPKKTTIRSVTKLRQWHKSHVAILIQIYSYKNGIHNSSLTVNCVTNSRIIIIVIIIIIIISLAKSKIFLFPFIVLRVSCSLKFSPLFLVLFDGPARIQTLLGFCFNGFERLTGSYKPCDIIASLKFIFLTLFVHILTITHLLCCRQFTLP